LFSTVSMAVGLVAFHYAMMTVPAQSMGLQVNLGWSVVALCFLVALPLTLVASSLQCIIAAFARGFREAQGYASMLVFVPMVPSMWLVFSPVKEALWMSAVPMFSQVVILNKLIRGEALAPLWIPVSLATSLALAAVLCLIAARLYNRPGMIFTD
jgi:sodium transport system permease protein